MARLISITCVGSNQKMNLLKFAQGSSTITTAELHSKACPIFTQGIDIVIAPKKDNRKPVVGEAKKKLPNAFGRLMGTNFDAAEVQYLVWHEVDNPQIDDQIRKGLHHLLESEEMGYFNIDQRDCLQAKCSNSARSCALFRNIGESCSMRHFLPFLMENTVIRCCSVY